MLTTKFGKDEFADLVEFCFQGVLRQVFFDSKLYEIVEDAEEQLKDELTVWLHQAYKLGLKDAVKVAEKISIGGKK